MWAPHPAYGGPEGLARLVEAAHREGLGVVLDVVYNHVGPGDEALRAFGPYFTDRHETFWGDAIDYSQPAVREWAIQNAVLWVRDYGIDGLRLDATHAVFDDSPTHLLAELAERVREANPRALVISEIEPGDLRPLRAWGHDAQWADELHHELHVLLTGERDGYYGDYGSLEGLAAQLERTPAERLVVCSQNHDQVGNRALGDRPRPEELRLRAAVRPVRPADAAALPGRGVRRAASLSLLHRPHRPGDRRRHARGAPARVRGLRRLRRRGGARPAGRARRSSARSSTPRRATTTCAPSTAGCSPCAGSFPARSPPRSRAACCASAGARSSWSPTSTHSRSS